MGVIYKITSPSGKVYVGKTYNMRLRFAAHRYSTKKGSSIILHNSIRKYGWSAHKVEVIEKVDDSILNEREIYWIAELKTYCYNNPMGLNMTLGGDGQRSSWMHKTELRKWYSEKFTGKGNPFYGKTHSEETRKVLSKKTSEYNKLNNIKIPEWGAEKGRAKVRREVVAYNNAGDFIGEFISLTDCAKKLNVHINGVKDSLIYGSWHRGQFMFKYKTENYPIKIDVGEIKLKTEKRPIVLLSDNLEIMAEYPSSKDASEFWGIPKTTINRAAMYNWGIPIRTGHSFIYKDLYKIIMQEAA